MFYFNLILYLFPVSSFSTFTDSLFYFSFQLTKILTIIPLVYRRRRHFSWPLVKEVTKPLKSCLITWPIVRSRITQTSIHATLRRNACTTTSSVCQRNTTWSRVPRCLYRPLSARPTPTWASNPAQAVPTTTTRPRKCGNRAIKAQEGRTAEKT